MVTYAFNSSIQEVEATDLSELSKTALVYRVSSRLDTVT